MTVLMFSVARLSREMYNTFGLFVFGSFVNQLLTDTTKYTIGWFGRYQNNIQHNI